MPGKMKNGPKMGHKKGPKMGHKKNGPKMGHKKGPKMHPMPKKGAKMYGKKKK